MEATVKRMEAQLKIWSSEIDALAAKTHKADVRVGFDALIHVDELKALHAIAQAAFDAFKAAPDAEREHLEVEMRSAWSELGAAFGDPRPPPRR